MADDVLEQVRRLALSEGLTEGGVMKAISEAANMMKREDREFNLRKQQFDRQAQSQDALLFGQLLGGLGDLGAFGKSEQQSYKFGVGEDGKSVVQPYTIPGQENWVQMFMNMFGGMDQSNSFGLSAPLYTPGGTLHTRTDKARR